MKRITLLTSTIVLPCLLMSGNALADEPNRELYADMHQQLTIMNDIIKSSVAGKSRQQRSAINSIQSTYLRGQGVVFTISSAAGNRQWGSYNFNFSMPEIPVMPVAPIAPEVNRQFHEQFDIDVNETVTQALDSASADYERVMEVFEENRDRARDLRDDQREIAYKLREVEREKRDTNYQLSRASDERKSALKQALKTLTEQEETLRAQQEEITQMTQKLASEQKAKLVERAKDRANYYQSLTVGLTETLCVYGNGLKSLPKDEHVSVILKSAGDRTTSGFKDSIMVFEKQDIISCSKDKINAEALLSKGQIYQF